MNAGNLSSAAGRQSAAGANTVMIADIGGTNARFALSNGTGPLTNKVSLRCQDYPDIAEAIAAYLRTCREQQSPAPTRMCLAVAAAADQDEIVLTNNPWQFSQQAIAHKFNMPVTAINDFTAQAWCLPALSEGDVSWMQRVGPNDINWTQGSRSIAGPGTGFGAATMTFSREVLESEPGQCAFAPLSPRQLAILVHLWDHYPRVTPDHLLSGPGLSNIYSALFVLNTGKNTEPVTPVDIVDAARHGDQIARQSLDEFSRILGAVCGDIALTMGSLGGFFLSGAILQKLDELFNRELFMSAFTDKGLFSRWCHRVPVAMINLADPGLQGCAAYSHR